MLSAERQQAATTALSSLEAERYGDLLDTITTFSIDSSSKAATVSYFADTVPLAIASLRNRVDGLATDDDWTRWVADAGEVHKGMADVKGYSSDWSLTSSLLATAKATAGDVAAGAQKVAAGAGVGAGVFVFVALAFVAWRVLR